MLFGGLNFRALLSVGVAVAVAAGGVAGVGLAASQAAGWGSAGGAADGGGAVVLIQSAPQGSPCGPAPATPCKEPDAQQKDESKAKAAKPKAKERRVTPCGPGTGIGPCN